VLQSVWSLRHSGISCNSTPRGLITAILGARNSSRCGLSTHTMIFTKFPVIQKISVVRVVQGVWSLRHCGIACNSVPRGLIFAIPGARNTGWVQLRVVETTVLTQPACFHGHTDEASTQSTGRGRCFYKPLRNYHPSQRVSTTPVETLTL